MMKLTGILIAAIASTTLVAPLATAEPFDSSEYPYCCQNNRSDWNRGRYGRSYDRSQLETLSGEVVSVEGNAFGRGNPQGTHLLVDTGRETIEVLIGPSWYLAERDFQITSEEKIAITGSRIDLYGKQAIIARQIEKGNETLILRDEFGFPLWRGWRR